MTTTHSKRRERSEQFRDHGGPGMSFSQELAGSAFALLRLALDERTERVWREPKNHYTQYAPGALVLITTAFDTWTTEFCVDLDPFDAAFRKIAERPICARYETLLETLSVTPPPHMSELRAVTDVRDEIVHFLPRKLPNRELPSWMAKLDERGLLIGANVADWGLSQKLGSYALAHWAFTTVATCVGCLVNATPIQKTFRVGWTGQNFWAIQGFPDLDDLAEVDRRRGLPPA